MNPELWNLLSPDDMRLIHQKTVELLESPGIFIDHEGFLSCLEERGATVDRSVRVARIPHELTEEAVAAAAQGPSLLKNDIQTVERSRIARWEKALQEPFQFRFGGCGLEVLNDDLRTSRRAGFADLERVVRFGNGHPRIGSAGGPPVQMAVDERGREIPPTLRPIAGMVYAAKHNAKLGWSEISNKEDVDFAARLGALVMNGEEAYRRNPVFLCVKCSISPLKIGPDAAEVLWELSRQGLPLGVAPMPLAGGTSPVTPAATILITNTDIMGMIVALFAARSVSKQEHLALTAVMDMQTGTASFSPPNVVQQDAAVVALYSSFYGIHCDAATDYIDAKFPGYQSGSERALKISALLSAGVVYPSVGQLNAGLICSPEQACLDIEAYDWMQHYLRGVDVNEKSLCTDLIRGQGIGGHFLDTAHTLDHFREELFLPHLADRNASEVRDMVGSAKEQVDRILAQTPVFTRGGNLCTEIDRLYDAEIQKREGLN
jgi:trimethylamine---corrinoid protein Co-methyltransferase